MWYLVCELLGKSASLLGESGCEHHDLLLTRSGKEDLLNLGAHVWCPLAIVRVRLSCLRRRTNGLENLVALIDDKVLDRVNLQCL